MSPLRRYLMLAALAGSTSTALGLPETKRTAAGHAGDAGDAGKAGVQRGRPLHFPRDHGAHLDTRIEWWYATGWLGNPQAPSHGFQLTFFRSATGLASAVQSRFAARHLLFAHVALTTLPSTDGRTAGRHQHDERLQRWNGETGSALADARLDDAGLKLGNWTLNREAALWQAQLPCKTFMLDVRLQRTQALLLQGDAGYSRKGPAEDEASHYYSEPQLAAEVRLGGAGGSPLPLSGRAWLDHEWSNQLLSPQAVGWDWMGINLFDGAALTVFVLRSADGQPVWAGGSYRAASGELQVFHQPQAVRLTPQRRWRSPASAGHYPVEWDIQCPAGRWKLRALMDAQELDGRNSTGTVYWEGLSELTTANGDRVGLGYLEMTGYAGRLQLP